MALSTLSFPDPLRQCAIGANLMNGAQVKDAIRALLTLPPDRIAEAAGEGIALDDAGNLYSAEATVLGVTKYVRD